MNLSLLVEELLLELSPDEIHGKYYKNIQPGAFYAVALSDPQTTIDPESKKILKLGKYTKILLNLFQKGKLKREDETKVKEYLEYAYKYHVPLDINKIQNLSDIYNSVKKYMNVDSQDLGVIMNSLSSDDYKVLLDGNEWLILQPLNEKSACYLGVGTQWCTTYGPYSLTKHYQDRDNYYDRYSKQGPLYIIINKANDKLKYQFHFETGQYMDSDDHQIKTGELLHNNPEIRNYFFPSFVKEVNEEEIQKELSQLALLSQDDALEIIQKVSGDIGENPLVVAILSQNREHINILIDDDNDLKHSVDIDDKEITFEIKHMTDELESVNDALRQLNSDKQNSWDQIYSNENENFRSNDEWQSNLEPLFKEYFEKNKYDAQYELGTPTYETFQSTYLQMFLEDESIQSEYIDSIVRKSYEDYESNIQEEINNIEKYLTIDRDEVKIKTAHFIHFLSKNKIDHIKNNLVTTLNQFIDETGIQTSDYEYYYNYQSEYPKYEDMESHIDKFFQDLIADMDNTKQCLEFRELFNDIFSNFFKNNVEYENEHVYIKILDTRVDCLNGTVSIIYKNKDKNKEYRGNVKIKNLPVYATNYELFESVTGHKLIN